MAAKKPKLTFPEYLKYQARLSLVPISVDLCLNDYFSDCIKELGNVLFFMKTYASKDEYVQKLLEAYDNLPPHMRRDSSRIDLDYLAEKAQVEKVIVKERILVALSRYGESKFKLIISVYGEEVIKEIVAIALDSAHPDSQKNKEMIAEYLGIKAIPKSAQINIQTNIHNEDHSTEVNAIGLTPMHETLMPIEKMIKEATEKRMLLGGGEQFVDIDELEGVDQKQLVELEVDMDDLDDLDEEEMEEEEDD